MSDRWPSIDVNNGVQVGHSLLKKMSQNNTGQLLLMIPEFL